MDHEKDRIDRILSREAQSPDQYPGMDKLKVGVIGISNGAGAGFLTGCLARYLANTGKHSPAVVELGKGSLFDSYGMDKRFAGRIWFRFFQALSEDRGIRSRKNLDEGINWILRTPEEENVELSFEQKLRLAGQAAGDVILCDLSGKERPDYEILKSMDRIIVVIDPMPSGMLRGYQTLRGMKALETEAEAGAEPEKCNPIYVINKMNRGVNQRQMMDFLKLKQAIQVPLVNPESIYTAEYNCNIPYVAGDVKRMLQEPLGRIVSALMQ